MSIKNNVTRFLFGNYKFPDVKKIIGNSLDSNSNILGLDNSGELISIPQNLIGGNQDLQGTLDTGSSAELPTSNLNIIFGDSEGQRASINGYADGSEPKVVLTAVDETNTTVGQLSINSEDSLFALDFAGKSFSLNTQGNGAITNSVSGISIEGQSKSISLNGQGGFILLIIPTYADNAGATTAGLPINALYKTVTGELRIRV